MADDLDARRLAAAQRKARARARMDAASTSTVSAEVPLATLASAGSFILDTLEQANSTAERALETARETSEKWSVTIGICRALEDGLEKVLLLHRESPCSGSAQGLMWCEECEVRQPCPTRVIVDETIAAAQAAADAVAG